MIHLQNLQKDYKIGPKQVTALQNVDLSVNKGEIFGVIGHSGAGKSTLLRCINLLERPTSGKVEVGGTDLTSLSHKHLQSERRRIGIIFQHFNLLSSATVFENIAFPLKLAKQPKAKIRERVNELLELVGLKDHSHKYPSQLSGGQKQRVGIARALANNPEVLLCDEATSALDPQTTNSILSLLQDINRQLGITILLITHEMHVIRSICDRVAVMDSGKIVETGKVLEVFLKPRHPVTREFVNQLSDAVDDQSMENVQPLSDHTGEGGKIIRVTFVGSQTYEPVLYEAVRSTGAAFAILQGTISKMKNTPYGQLIVELRGSSADTDHVIAALREKGLDVEVLR